MPDHTGPSVVLVFVMTVAFVSFRWAASCALATRCSDVAARGALIMIFPLKFVSFLMFSAALGRHSFWVEMLRIGDMRDDTNTIAVVRRP